MFTALVLFSVLIGMVPDEKINKSSSLAAHQQASHCQKHPLQICSNQPCSVKKVMNLLTKLCTGKQRWTMEITK